MRTQAEIAGPTAPDGHGSSGQTRRVLMEGFPQPASNTRYGFHYFPDPHHYRESDLRAWLPELRALGATWLTLVAPPERAIPEPFLRGLLDAGIEPVLHFRFPLSSPPAPDEMRLLLETYARWGVHYAALFDRPNRRMAWSTSEWARHDLVERFLDRFVPIANAAVRAGLVPVFPPLEPGGDYWDTAFLRTGLQALQRRGHARLLRKLVLGAYGWAANRPLRWGAGGPERWPGARPYRTPGGEEDQRGFRIFDWYIPIARAALGESPPLLLLGMGSLLNDRTDPLQPPIDEQLHAERNIRLAGAFAGERHTGAAGDPAGPGDLPPEVLAGTFWLLAADRDSPHQDQAWFPSDGGTLPAVGALRQWVSERAASATAKETPSALPINHYLLLPRYEWGVADWHLDVIRPFIKRHHPTVGFSLQEAAMARHVTVLGGPQTFPEADLERLASAGCQVERIEGDGTSIASQMATR